MGVKTKELLGVYLNDQLAGSTAGMGLARRIAASAEHTPAPAGVLKRFAAEVTEDRATLVRIMAALGIRVRGYKMYAAWAGEKLGRLKPSRCLPGRSPLCSLEELEIMRLDVEGKAAGWRTLRSLADRDSRLDAGRLDELIARAAGQADLLETLRADMAERIFS